MKEILYEKKHIATLSKEERLGKMWGKKKPQGNSKQSGCHN